MTVDTERLAGLFGAASVGVLPALPHLPAFFPDDPEAACEALRFAAREALRVIVAGAGEHLPPGAATQAAGFVMSMQRLDRILEYEPEDLVVTVQAGVTLRALTVLVAPHAQRLGPDAAFGQAATVGGAAAANRCGIARRVRGTWRDAVLGARVAHADGRISRTGSRVVKNVTGFDLAKVYVGSRGRLGLFTELDLRLGSRPVSSATAVTMVARATLHERWLEVHHSPLAPVALVLVEGEFAAPGTTARAALPAQRDHSHLVARFEGHAKAVRWQVQEFQRLLGGEEWLDDKGDELEAALRQGLEPRIGQCSARILCRPTHVAAVLDALRTGANPPAGILALCNAGVLNAHWPVVHSTDGQDLVQRLAAVGARIEFEALPAGVEIASREALDPVAQDLVRQMQTALDPAGLFATGAAPGGAP